MYTIYVTDVSRQNNDTVLTSSLPEFFRNPVTAFSNAQSCRDAICNILSYVITTIRKDTGLRERIKIQIKPSIRIHPDISTEYLKVLKMVNFDFQNNIINFQFKEYVGLYPADISLLLFLLDNYQDVLVSGGVREVINKIINNPRREDLGLAGHILTAFYLFKEEETWFPYGITGIFGPADLIKLNMFDVIDSWKRFRLEFPFGTYTPSGGYDRIIYCLDKLAN